MGLGAVAVISVARAELMEAATPAVPVPDKVMEAAKPEVPLPDKLTVCGLSTLLSLMVRVPLKIPRALGVKVTVIVQDAPAPTLAPQSFVCEKCSVVVMLLTLSTLLPGLVSVSGRDLLKNWPERRSLIFKWPKSR